MPIHSRAFQFSEIIFPFLLFVYPEVNNCPLLFDYFLVVLFLILSTASSSLLAKYSTNTITSEVFQFQVVSNWIAYSLGL